MRLRAYAAGGGSSVSGEQAKSGVLHVLRVTKARLGKRSDDSIGREADNRTMRASAQLRLSRGTPSAAVLDVSGHHQESCKRSPRGVSYCVWAWSSTAGRARAECSRRWARFM